MKFSRHKLIRELLIDHEDGLTIQEIANHLNSDCEAIRKSIKSIWGVYIDRWTEAKRGQFSAVYMCVTVPTHTPHPKERYISEALLVKSSQRSHHEIHC